jgi:hypothetical protein
MRDCASGAGAPACQRPQHSGYWRVEPQGQGFRAGFMEAPAMTVPPAVAENARIPARFPEFARIAITLIFSGKRPPNPKPTRFSTLYPRFTRCKRRKSAPGAQLRVPQLHRSGELVVTRLQGVTRVTLRGPVIRATTVVCPPNGQWIAIRLSLGTYLPQLPTRRVTCG